MARRSRWQNFSDSFNSVYGTFNQVGKAIESKKVMNTDYEDDAGNALAGDALDRRRMMELSKVYTKYGDAEGGLGLRAQQAKIEQAKRENDINQQIMQELIRQRGGLTTQGMEADIANTEANTADTQSTTDRRNKLVPGELDQQEATLADTQANTANTRSITDRRNKLVPGEVENLDRRNEGLGATNRSLVAQADVDEATVGADIAAANADASMKTDDARVSSAAVDSEIDATVSGNQATAAGNKVKTLKSTIDYDQLDAEEQLLMELNQTEYDSPEDAEAAYREMVIADRRIAPERKAQIIRALDDVGLAQLQGQATKMAQGAQNALQSGGLDGLVEYYDTIDDGDSMEIRRNDNGTISIVATRGDDESVLFSATGKDAESIVTQQMFNQVSRPGTGFEVVVQAANVEKTRAQTDLIGKQAFSEMVSQDLGKARRKLVEAQIRETNQKIQQSGQGLQGTELIAQEGLADLQKSAEFIMLGDQEGGSAIQDEVVGAYMRRMGMKDAPPAGVEAQLWFQMTDEEKAEFNK